MSQLQIILFGLFVTMLFGISTPSVLAQAPPLPIDGNDCEGPTFGCFEVGLPGIPSGQSIDSFVNEPKPILRFINLAVNVTIAVLVIIGLITIVIAGYIYMTASGNGSQVEYAKTMIKAALFGIFLSLISVIILNTINIYLGSEAEEPKLGERSGSAGTAGGSGAGSGGGGGTDANGNGLPNNGQGTTQNNATGNQTNNTLPATELFESGRIGRTITKSEEGKMITVILDERSYYIRGSDGKDRLSSVDEIVNKAQNDVTGDTNKVRVRLYETVTGKSLAEKDLLDALGKNAPLDKQVSVFNEERRLIIVDEPILRK